VVPLHLGYLLQMTLPTVASHPESSPAPGTGLHRLKANLANWLRKPSALMGNKVSTYLFNVFRYIPIER